MRPKWDVATTSHARWVDIDELATVPVDLSKLSNVVKTDVVEKTVYDKLVAKVDIIDTSDFVSKTNFNTKITGSEIKFLILVVLLKRLITILKLLK